MIKRAYAIVVPVLTVALTAAATFLSTRTEIRPDVASVSFGFPFSWLSIAHGFINAPPLWVVDSLALAGDMATWLPVSVAVVYLHTRLRRADRTLGVTESVPNGSTSRG